MGRPRAGVACVLALIGGTLALPGCGVSIRHVDQRRAEALIRQLIAQAHGRPPRSVWCPPRTLAKPGTSFECRAVSATGYAATVTEHVENASGRLTAGLADVHVTSVSSGIALGTPVRFRNLPGVPPAAAVVLVAGQPIDPGWGKNGVGYAEIPAAQVWPSYQPQAVELVPVRLVNLPVTITNIGRAPLRFVLVGAATDEHGREAGAVLSDDAEWPGPYGRQPDWTSRSNPPIEHGARATRYITFPIPQGSRTMDFSLWPMSISSARTSSMSPESVSFRGQ